MTTPVDNQTSSNLEQETQAVVDRILGALPRIGAGMRRHGMAASGCGASLGPRHFQALLPLLHEGTLGVGALAQRLDASLAATSLMVAEMDAAGVVERHQDPDDRRRTLVSVRSDVRSELEGAYSERRRLLARAIERLGAEERVGLVRGLEAIADELHADATDSP